VNGVIANSLGAEQVSLSEIAGAARYRQYSIPLERIPTLEVVTSYVPKSVPYIVANGVQAASVEVDVGTGIIKLLNFWVVDECGRVINPLLVDEQLRGGAVQGIGAALYEVCAYSAEGQILNGNLADYLVPMASEMPDIDIAHISTLTRSTELGSKGVGEAGTIGAPGAVWTAVNDALRPLGVQVTRQPFDIQEIVEMLKDRKQS
jgi:carbon-monoxide dehydrogenase large subunit